MCSFEDCKETYYFKDTDKEVLETNCFISTCLNSTATGNCDTKVYVTQVGTDAIERPIYSDNYRITRLFEHSI